MALLRQRLPSTSGQGCRGSFQGPGTCQQQKVAHSRSVTMPVSKDWGLQFWISLSTLGHRLWALSPWLGSICGQRVEEQLLRQRRHCTRLSFTNSWKGWGNAQSHGSGQYGLVGHPSAWYSNQLRFSLNDPSMPVALASPDCSGRRLCYGAIVFFNKKNTRTH